MCRLLFNSDIPCMKTRWSGGLSGVEFWERALRVSQIAHMRRAVAPIRLKHLTEFQYGGWVMGVVARP